MGLSTKEASLQLEGRLEKVLAEKETTLPLNKQKAGETKKPKFNPKEAMTTGVPDKTRTFLSDTSIIQRIKLC
ncbi:hypothetical protein [Wolbachia endosymbiont of Ctenocephalides felis wCfeT]|uniref:hypothetical protein n=1 Tax=Wolbachia endosymbiont of Ctenocephalides felis wCfeT TaxID=2732593 RepID=UPI0014462420|nr:hypothetical protein [Wolbachia endosymbiont of Ctenocephalides felis wCfeT]